ncbi:MULTISPECIES: hypothetical protein [unclassified Streptomyces]|uniref:hypothetical protein n=1 Tax=unclassified Streptomyces TaxID=2593676 RepID=UPI0006ADD0C0|nr:MULTISPECIES: hypothetical protein [unclassified Streptomyces]KOX37235.1 hypothetical protein ADL06_03625 [Streptomyces sp. NRRL F-6491]KOX40996.1 hypothetical protein ADL08_20795 [Streptomyces sp. NRRL F-6492]
MTDDPALHTLTLRHRIPDDWAADPWAEVRPLIDGVDVLKEVHPDGMAPSCRYWTGPAGTWPLAAAEEPRRIMITEPTCTAGCCGALYVTVRREGGLVVWDSWENTGGSGAVPPPYRFDAARYEAELARAAADRDWEERVDTVARLLGRILDDSGWFARWDCVLTNVSPRREEPGVPEELTNPEGVDVDFHHDRGPGNPPDVYRYELLTTHDGSPEQEAHRLAAPILAADPRGTAWKPER